ATARRGQGAGDVDGEPGGQRPGVLGRGQDGGVEHAGGGRVVGDEARVLRPQPQARVARGALGGELGEGRGQLDYAPRQVDAGQVRVGQVAVVLGALLHAHRVGALPALVEAARLLHDRAARLEQALLALDLEGDR